MLFLQQTYIEILNIYTIVTMEQKWNTNKGSKDNGKWICAFWSQANYVNLF